MASDDRFGGANRSQILARQVELDSPGEASSVAPLDGDTVVREAAKTGRVVVVDEDYTRGGLSGEIAARISETGVSAAFARVTTETTIPYARHLEDQVLPSVDRIVAAVERLLER